MAATLQLVETAESLTYTGIGEMLGYSLVIQKRSDAVDIHQVIPTSLSDQTWQALKADLADRLI